jgi:UDP-N-acetylmuramoylalanine--D-glutamate ligase
MIHVTVFSGKHVAVFGLGGSGLATCRALVAGGARVTAFDDSPQRVADTAKAGIETADLRTLDWSDIAALVLTPGVPLTHPAPHWSARLAQQHGVEIIGDIELFCREHAKAMPQAPFVAITGTNGKSTTTALIAHILRSAGRDVAMGGNIGVAILSLPPLAAATHYVVEVSSYQIDLAPSLAPTIGVFLNVTPDHIDRHGTLENYAAIKERLIAKAATAVIAIDDDFTLAAAARRQSVDGNVVLVSATGRPDDGIFFEDGKLYRVGKDHGAPFADLAGIGALRGRHNGQNAAAACAVAFALGLAPDAIQPALSSFPGLPHRIEEVGRRGKVIYVNDSKATNADSTEKALESFPSDIFWILGGKSKEGGIAALEPFFPRVSKAYLIGEAADVFAATLEGKVAYERCGTLDNAVARASADAAASPGNQPVVLLSPACASFDQFPNFEVRGDAFRALVRAIDGVSPRS